MIECFHRSFKSSLQARLAGSNWVNNLPLGMLGLRASPKDDSGFSPAEAVYSPVLSLPGKFLKHSEIPLENFLCRVEQAVLGFSRPPQHQAVPQPQPQPLPQTLLDAEFVFVRDNALKPNLSPL